MKKPLLLAFVFLNICFLSAQDSSVLDELNKNFKEDSFSDQYEVQAYKSMWSARNKSGAIIIIYETTFGRQNAVFKNLGWDEYRVLEFLLTDNDKVIYNAKSGVLHSPYRGTGN